jgi:multidrug efflux pump subunit AcrB
VEDDLPLGKQEIELKVTTKGKAMGFTTESVARQVRNAFEGAIAKRFIRGDEEVTVRIQYPRATLGMATFRALHLRGPDGSEVRLSEIVSISGAVGFDRIRRENGRREVAVTGEIDEAVTNADRLYPALIAAGLDTIVKRHGLSYRFAGKAEEQARTFADMKFGAAIAMISIYVILAWVFASYSRPFIVMAVIPFGLVGAVLGHMFLGFNLTVLSLVALLGLSGILVNDSIILVSTIDERIAAGEKTLAAIVSGSQDRLRAVILTSLTTILGLTPLLFERSLQAQFLIPMAITIVFGLAVATFLVLFLVPALLAIGHDFARLLGRSEFEAAPRFRPAKSSA